MPERLITTTSLVILLILWVGANGAGAQTPEHLTQSQAVQIAATYCAKMGQAVGAPTSVETPEMDAAHDQSPNAILSHWQKYWKITFTSSTAPHIEVEVNDATGDICEYFAFAFSSNGAGVSNPVSEGDAVASATKALTEAGAFKTKELQLKESFYEVQAANTASWAVIWTRMFDGIPFRTQGANVSVDAATGAVVMLSVNFRTDVPKRTIIDVSQQEAEDLAVRVLNQNGLEQAQQVSSRLEVLRPNTKWSPGGNESDRSKTASIAWRCEYKLGDNSYNVWIDANDGALDGGEIIGRRSPIVLRSNAKKK